MVLCRVLEKKSPLHYLSIKSKGERREPAGNLGIKGSREVELECLSHSSVTGLGHALKRFMRASLLDQLESCGLVTVGIDGCGWQWEMESSWN